MIVSATSIGSCAEWLFAFTRDIFNENSWPLRLRLISETELVQIFIARTSSRPTFVARSKNPLSHHARRNGNRFANRSPSPALPLKVATIASFYALVFRPPDNILMMRRLGSTLPALCLRWISDSGARTGDLWGEQPRIAAMAGAGAYVATNQPYAGELAAPLQPAGRSFCSTGGKLPDANGANHFSDTQKAMWCGASG